MDGHTTRKEKRNENKKHINLYAQNTFSLMEISNIVCYSH